MTDTKYSKEYRELEFMVMRYNTLMAELKNFGQSRRSIYHKHSDNFENDSVSQSESQKEALEIQKTEIMAQLTKIREFVYINGGCPDEDLLPLLPENQRKKQRESVSSISYTSDANNANYYPPQPLFGPFNKSMADTLQSLDSASDTAHLKPLKKPQFLTGIAAKNENISVINTQTNSSNKYTDTPVPSKLKNKISKTNIIAAFSAPQHLKSHAILQEKETQTQNSNSNSNLSPIQNMTANAMQHSLPPSRSISQQSISLPNSTTREERASIVEFKLEELEDLNTDIDDDSDSNESDTLFPLHLTLKDPNRLSLRAQLWSVLLDFSFKEHTHHKEYIKVIEKGKSIDWNNKILKDAQRTFLTSREFNSRVSEHQIVRILNAFVVKNEKAYCQGMDAIAGIMLYVMHETYAFQLLNVLMSVHFPLYFRSERDTNVTNTNSNHSSLIGSYAGTYLAYDILQIWDNELFAYLSDLHPYQYIFPLIASFQAISQPLSQVQKLWDYLFAYGVYLNPIIAVSQLIVNRKKLLSQSIPQLLMGLLSQRKWMANKLNAKAVIKVSSLIANKLSATKEHKNIWFNIQLHSSDFNTAFKIKLFYDRRLKEEGRFDIGRNGMANNHGFDNSDGHESPMESSSDWNQSSDSSGGEEDSSGEEDSIASDDGESVD